MGHIRHDRPRWADVKSSVRVRSKSAQNSRIVLVLCYEYIRSASLPGVAGAKGTERVRASGAARRHVTVELANRDSRKVARKGSPSVDVRAYIHKNGTVRSGGRSYRSAGEYHCRGKSSPSVC